MKYDEFDRFVYFVLDLFFSLLVVESMMMSIAPLVRTSTADFLLSAHLSSRLPLANLWCRAPLQILGAARHCKSIARARNALRTVLHKSCCTHGPVVPDERLLVERLARGMPPKP